MFIISKRNYRVRRADGSFYTIKKDFIGAIPEDVAESNLVQRAIRGGMICVPQGTGDLQLEEAGEEAAKKAAENDVRPDATGQPEGEVRVDDAGQPEGEEEKTEKAKAKSTKR